MQVEPTILLNLVRAELERLQLHTVNLRVEMQDEHFVALHGSLLAYWQLPHRLPAAWLLERLRELPDAAGPVAVMEGLLAVCQTLSVDRTQLMLFDPSAATVVAPTTAARKDL